MDTATRLALNAVNRRFYAEHAADFSATRADPWPGWEAVAAATVTADSPRQLSVLDLGCGNGRFGAYLASFLAERGRTMHYLGIDASGELLEAAEKRLAALSDPPARRLVQHDFVAEPLEAALGPEPFDLIALFGLLHHLPGRAFRRHLLAELVNHLAPGGLLAAALWRFGAEERFERKILPWHDYNHQAAEPIPLDQLEAGDYLLTWGQTPQDAATPTCRYCHFVDDEEEAELLTAVPAPLLKRLDADGASGQLNRYLLFQRPG